MIAAPPLKPWPADAVMVVCSPPDEANLADLVHGIVVAWCRDCGRPLLCCARTLASALAHPRRLGRPVRHFCSACASAYTLAGVKHVHDDRPGSPQLGPRIPQPTPRT